MAVQPKVAGLTEMVSPPSSGTAYSVRIARSPSTKRSAPSTSTAPISTPSGVAPLAARSDRFTATSFQAMSNGSVPGR